MAGRPYESFYLQELTAASAERAWRYPPAPLLPIAVGLVLGIACDAHWPVHFLIYVSVFVVSGVGVWLSRSLNKLCHVLLIVCAATVGGVLHEANFRHLPENHIARYVTHESVLTTIEGRILRTPRLIKQRVSYFAQDAYRPPRTRFLLALERAFGQNLELELVGPVQVTVQEPMFDLYLGDRVRVFGKLYKPRPPANPGQFDWALHQRRQGIHAGMSCGYAEALQKLPSDDRLSWLTWLGYLRLQAQTLLHDNVLGDDPDQRSLLDAMLLGQRSHVDQEILLAFRRTGTSHFLALSGLHVGLLALFVWFLGRALILSKRKTTLLVMFTLIVYAVIVEPRPSVLRATIIVVVFCVGYLLRRPVNFLNSLSLAAIILLVWDPLQLFQPGFQLSFVVTLGIMFLVPIVGWPLHFWLRMVPAVSSPSPQTLPDRKYPGVVREFSDHLKTHVMLALRQYALFTCSVCLVAWLVGSPLAAYHFNSLFTYGWPFTAILWPFVLLTMLSGFLKLLLGLFWPSTSLVLGPLLEWTTHALVWMTKVLSGFPVTRIDVPTPAWWWLVLFYSFIGAIVLWRLRITVAGRLINFRWLSALGACVLFASLPPFLPHGPTSEMRITVLSVGAGSATIIELPDGRTCLYDVGTQGDFDVGANTMVPALRELGIRRIDKAIISHANFDHYSGLLSVCDRVSVDEVVTSPHFERFAQEGEADRRFLDQLHANDVAIRLIDASHKAGQGSLTVLESVQTEVLWPPLELPENIRVNDTSLVVRLTYSGHSVLFTGDIDEYAEEMLLESELDLHADVLILPHHGSVKSSTVRFIAAVDPRYVIRSSAKKRADRLSAIEQIVKGYQYFNTADVGAVTITLREQQLSVESFRPPASPEGRAAAP